MEAGHILDYAVELHMRPPWAVTEQGHQAIVNSYVDRVRTEWVGKQTHLSVIVYDDPTTWCQLKLRRSSGGKKALGD